MGFLTQKTLTNSYNEGINRFVSFYGNTNIEEDLSMNKTELVAAIAEQAGVSKKDAEKTLKAFTDVVADELKKGGKVQ